jgi:metal-responsive CopG/Arc/MetJ family transcriptional regulator
VLTHHPWLSLQEQLRECRSQLSQFLSPAAMGLQKQQLQQQQQQQHAAAASSQQQESQQLLQRLVKLEQHYHSQMGSLEHQILQLRASDGDLGSVRSQFHQQLASLESEVRLHPLPAPAFQLQASQASAS